MLGRLLPAFKKAVSAAQNTKPQALLNQISKRPLAVSVNSTAKISQILPDSLIFESPLKLLVAEKKSANVISDIMSTKIAPNPSTALRQDQIDFLNTYAYSGADFILPSLSFEKIAQSLTKYNLNSEENISALFEAIKYFVETGKIGQAQRIATAIAAALPILADQGKLYLVSQLLKKPNTLLEQLNNLIFGKKDTAAERAEDTRSLRL